MPVRAVPACVASPAAEAALSPQVMASILTSFLATHTGGAVLEDGKTIFELSGAQHKVEVLHDRLHLQVWSGERNLVRTVLAVEERKGSLRLSTHRFGQLHPRTLTLVPAVERRERKRREPARQAYLRLLQRVLTREFPDYECEGFTVAMDLEKSFGPAYARGSLLRGNEAWAVIGVAASESQSIIDGVLTLGVLWLHHCRERGAGRRLYKGLRVIAPRKAATLTLARLPWMNTAAAQWELFELDEKTEELLQRDPADQGNLRTGLVHYPDQEAAQERFAGAVQEVFSLVPEGEQGRVEQRLRSTTELAFLLHGLEFARARVSLAPGSFAQTLEITVGVGLQETVLESATRRLIQDHLAELFRRRSAMAFKEAKWQSPSLRPRIAEPFGRPAHHRAVPTSATPTGMARLEWRERVIATQQDPLYRAVPERWLESVLRDNLAPLTRSVAPIPKAHAQARSAFANDADQDAFGNRAEPERRSAAYLWGNATSVVQRRADSLIPRFDPRFVYSQVPAIAGASDRGLLDLLGMTEDGRLAVIELKTSDDLQLTLQGLDYWIRVRHHHIGSGQDLTWAREGSDLQRHGYFRDAELAPEPPRLFLIAPALHIHPATETILRYLSPRVEWTLLALDERWRQEIRVVWRRSGGTGDTLRPG